MSYTRNRYYNKTYCHIPEYFEKKKFDKPQISLNEDKTLTKTTDYGAWYNAYR